MNTITLDGDVIPYRTRRSRRAKNVSIKAGTGGIVVVVPRRARVDVEAVLRRNAGWVRKHRRRLDRLQARIPVRRYEEGEAFPVLGTDRTLTIRPGDTSRITDDHLILSRRDAQNHGLREAVEHLYRETARTHYAGRAAHFGKIMGAGYESLHVRNQKTRWGSYSTRTGTLSMNVRLLMAPPEVVDYVIVHELCHVTHPNHSDAFWRLVQRYDPDFREKEAWLKRHGPTLVF